MASLTSQLESGQEEKGVRNSTTNPLLIEDILHEIVSYLPTKDLLRCRLVNHLLNTICVGALKKKNRTIELTDSNVSEYMELMQNSKIKISQLGLVSFSVNFVESATQAAVDQLMTSVEKLIANFGPECVKFIQFYSSAKYGETVDWIRVWKLIQSASAGLRHIIIGEEASIASKCITLLDLDFPQLTRLHFGGFTNNPTTACQLINASPKLQELALMELIEQQQDDNRFPNQAVVTTLNGIDITITSNLKKLRIAMGNIDTFNALGKLVFHQLKTLVLHMKVAMDPVMEECLQQFLVNKCPKLTSLEFVFHDREDLKFGVNFPKLPNLKHFGYHADPYCGNGYELVAFINVDHFSTDKLPGLDSVSTQMGGCFLSTDVLYDGMEYDEDVNWYDNPQSINNIQFPSVSTLNLKLLYNNYKYDYDDAPGLIQISLLDNVNQLAMLYPNLTKIVINNQLEPDLMGTNEESSEILDALLEEMLPRIEEIEFFNYYEDWIGHILKEFPEKSMGLRNLRKLTLHAVDKKWRCVPMHQFESCGYHYNSSPTKDVFMKCTISLQDLLHHIPSLQTLRIAEEFLTKDPHHRFVSQGVTPAAREEIQNLKIAFPELEIELI